MSYDHCALDDLIVSERLKKGGSGPSRRTLDPYVDVVLRLLSLASIFVGFGEGV